MTDNASALSGLVSEQFLARIAQQLARSREMTLSAIVVVDVLRRAVLRLRLLRWMRC